MNAQHTKGPWEIEQQDYIVKRFANSRECAVICDFSPSIYRDRQAANMALVAAAPEMYAALEGLVNIVTHPNATKAQMRQIAQEARAIIAKAKPQEA